ncbi:ABC transporter substrate-binding protein [Sulfolobus sp. E11-6]|uniref:ABC transporter substrate-binding protein n=1 Tax=Sulfolobus sp. E11-6 TaxID=2663020 RepID=UPI0012963288|nr:ABC transporter substrate-binding protein [Sulfolobus sp. E11-6]QGA67574.1 ABC transporter substrate-binding protein [Sulfolobus sp. E11-6]
MPNAKVSGTIVAIIIVVGIVSVFYYYKSSTTSNPVTINNNLRIVSLAPSDTQILISLGLGKYIVGIDYYSYQLLQSLNFTKYIPSNVTVFSQISPPNISGLLILHPTVIVVEEGLIGSYIEQMKEAGLNVLITNNDFASSYSQIENCILKVGEYFNVTSKAQQLIDWMNQKISDFSSTGDVSVAYLLWICPDLSFYTAGGNVFINSIIVQAGGINVFANYSGYPLLTPSQLLIAKPSVIIAQEEYNLTYTDYLLSQYKGINSSNVYVMGNLATNLFNEPGPLSVYSIQEIKLIIQGKAPHFISDNWVVNNLNVTLPVF